MLPKLRAHPNRRLGRDGHSGFWILDFGLNSKRVGTTDPQSGIPDSQAAAAHRGPLHLQRYLSPCCNSIAAAIRSSAQHRIDVVLSLQCRCTTPKGAPSEKDSGLHPLPPHAKDGHIERRTSVVRRRNIESGSVPAARAQASSPGGGAEPGGKAGEQLKPCCILSLQLNDEEGIVHAYCRRCNRRLIVYDRALYWGTKRQNGQTPPTYPYQCTCGGHAFEIALGLEYPPEALDENDLDTITVAVRCAGCGEVAVIFEDEVA